MLLRQDFCFLFDYDVVRCLVEGVLDRPRLVEGYPFLSFDLYQSLFLSASMATLSLIPLTLDITSLN